MTVVKNIVRGVSLPIQHSVLAQLGSKLNFSTSLELTSTGDGSGVSTLKLEVEKETTLTLDGSAKFYDDSSGTTNEGTERTVTPGAMRTFYLKCPSGTANLVFSDARNVLKWGDDGNNGWDSETNAASIGGTVEDMKALIYLRVDGSNTLSGSVSGLPSGLTYLRVFGSNTLTGDVSELPSGLTYLNVQGYNTLTGDVSGLPSGLTILYVSGSNTLTGDVSGLPSGLTILRVSGSNTLTGDVSGLPSGLTILYVTGSNTISDYTTRTWTTKPATFNLQGNAALTSTEVDQLLIDFDADLTWSSGDTITITGDCQPRTSASDAAVANIIAEGATVTTN